MAAAFRRRSALTLGENKRLSRGRNAVRLWNEDHQRNVSQIRPLSADLKGAFSRRINIQRRLVDQVYEQEQVVKVLRLWTHYE